MARVGSPAMSSTPDDVLHLLRRRGRNPDPSALDSLMRGVAAAPQGLAGPEWVELVDSDADAELTEALTAWREELAQADDGLDASPAPATRLAALRAELKRRGVDGFVVPRADEHQGEYVPRRSQRLAWLTGFRGSAGLAIVLGDRAAIFIDGRYTLAVRSQVDTEAFVPLQIPEQSPDAWIAANLSKGGRLGFDPWLQTVDGHERFARACQRAGGEFVALESNPVDAVWLDRPPPPLAPVLPHPDEYAGESSEAKRSRIGGIVKAKDADVALITAPDSIAWLLNVRGGDVPRTPFPLGFALLHGDGHVDLYMDRRKVPDRTVAWLGNAVTLAPPGELPAALDTLGKIAKRVLIETATAPIWAANRLQAAGAALVREPTRWRSPRPARIPSSSRAFATPIAATAPPSAASWAGLPPNPRRVGCARSRFRTGSRRCARKPASCEI